jgi:hypothetical protein
MGLRPPPALYLTKFNNDHFEEYNQFFLPISMEDENRPEEWIGIFGLDLHSGKS